MTQPPPQTPPRGRFRLRFWPTFGTLVGLSMLVALGTWQLNRYLVKVDLEAERARNLDENPVEITSLAEFRRQAKPFSPIVLRGRLLPEYTVLFKHRVKDGKPGYWVGGVVEFAQGDGAVLVNRGWIHREEADSFASNPPGSDASVFLGLVHQPRQIVADTATRRALESDKRDLREDVTRWDTYDLTGISTALPYDMPDPPAIVVLDPRHSGQPYPKASYDYVTQPYLTSERHLSYAVFWYATGLALLGMYLAYSFGYIGSRQRGRLKKSTAESE